VKLRRRSRQKKTRKSKGKGKKKKKHGEQAPRVWGNTPRRNKEDRKSEKISRGRE